MAHRLLNMTTAVVTAMFENYRSEFNRAFQSFDERSLYRQLSSVMDSSTSKEIYDMGWLVGGVKEWKDQREISTLEFDTYEITNKKWEQTLRILRTDLEDDRTGMIRQKIQQLASGMARHIDQRLADLFNAHMAGTVTTFPAGFDGKSLFSATHGWDRGEYTTAQSNLRSGSSTGVFNATNLKAAIGQLEGYKFADGGYTGSVATDLIVGSDLKYEARQLVNSQELNYRGTTDGEAGKTNPLYQDNLNVTVLPGVTTGYWAVADMSKPIKPLLTQMRIRPQFESQTDGDTAFMSDAWDYGTRGRYELGIGPWWLIVGGNNT